MNRIVNAPAWVRVSVYAALLIVAIAAFRTGLHLIAWPTSVILVVLVAVDFVTDLRNPAPADEADDDIDVALDDPNHGWR